MSVSYNLNVSPSSLSNGEMKQVEVPGVKDQFVLLSKVNDKVYATSPKCTHYGAPLTKGVLSTDGKVTCPWHGACFRVDTGDIEDAPALDALQSYPVTIENDSVHIKASAEAIQAGRRLPTHCEPNSAQIAQASEKVVIVGGGSGATGAMEGLRDFGFTGSITVLSKEPHRPLDRIKLSKSLMTDINKLQLRPESFYNDLKIDLKTSTTVTSVDFGKKEVKTESGEVFPYTKLVLAPGGAPRRLPLPGFDGPNVFVLRSIKNAEDISKALEGGPKKVAIVGASFIGTELAVCLKGKEHDVTVIGMETYPFEAILGPKIGEVLLNIHKASGIKFRLGASVERVQEGGKGVVLKGGEVVEADVIVLGVGVAPATEFLKGSEVELQRDGGLKVDPFMRVLGQFQDSVYAVGDVAHFPYTGYTKAASDAPIVRIEHWDVAQNQGRTAARHIASVSDVSSVSASLSTKAAGFSNVPYFWSAQGAQIRYCGYASAATVDEIIIQGSFEEKKWAGFYVKGGEVIAVISMGYDPVVSKSAELLRIGAMPTVEEIRGGFDVRNVKPTKHAGAV